MNAARTKPLYPYSLLPLPTHALFSFSVLISIESFPALLISVILSKSLIIPCSSMLMIKAAVVNDSIVMALCFIIVVLPNAHS